METSFLVDSGVCLVVSIFKYFQPKVIAVVEISINHSNKVEGRLHHFDILKRAAIIQDLDILFFDVVSRHHGVIW